MKKLITILSVVMVVMGCKEQPKQQPQPVITTKTNNILDTVILICVQLAPEDEQEHQWIEYQGKNYSKVNLIKYDNDYDLFIEDGEIVETNFNNVNNESKYLIIYYTPNKQPPVRTLSFPGIRIQQH